MSAAPSTRALNVAYAMRGSGADCVASPRIGCYACRGKVSEVTRMLRGDGWFLVATRGSYRKFKHATTPGRVTVPGKPGDDLAPGTLNSILKQAGLK